jgi:hypothetical protein
MVSKTSSPIQQLGDRFLGISSYVCDFTPSGTYDVDSLKYLQVSQSNGSNLSQIQVVKSLWLQQIETVLGIETPKGSSKSFVFTYNGSTWDLTGDASVSAISTQDLNDVYGITFTGTESSGNAITVIETQYNKFTVYVLDANYRGNGQWGVRGTNIMPKQYSSNPQTCIESATYFNQYIFDNVNLSNYGAFNFCKNKGNFLLPNGIKINALIPNGYELLQIYNNRVDLDSLDPIIQSGSTSYNLTNWSFEQSKVYTCLEVNNNNAWVLQNNGTFRNGSETSGNKQITNGIIPVFEVPVM